MDNRSPASMKKFKELLGMRESSGDYKAKNRLGYLGKYQFGKMALQDAGYKDKKGNWTGKNGVTSEEEFLNNQDAQEEAMDTYSQKQRKYLKRYGADKLIGRDFKGIPVTESGLLAAAHLIGAKGISKAIEKDEDTKDAFGTPASEYLDKFKGIDLDAKEEDNMKKLEELKKQIDETKKSPQLRGSFQDGGTVNQFLSEQGLPIAGSDRDNYVEEDAQTRLQRLIREKEELESKSLEVPEVVEDVPTEDAPTDKDMNFVPEEPTPVREVTSEASKSPVRDSKPKDESMSMSDLEKRYNELMKASAEERKTAQWATAATQIASMLDKFSARPVGIKPINFKAEVAPAEVKDLMNLGRMKGLDQEMTPYQQQALELRRRQIDLMENKQTAAPSFEQKEEKKAEIKQRLADKKEEKEVKKTAQQALSALDTQEQQINKALKMLEEEGASTGPIDQYISGFTEKGQKLRKALNNIALDKMVKMFSGMSKAIDSDAERRFFESTQPSMADYESVNIETLKELRNNIESLRAKTKAKLKGQDVAPKQEEASNIFPMKVRKGNQVATVSNEAELEEARAEGFE